MATFLTPAPSMGGLPEWQGVLKERIMAQQADDTAHGDIIQQYRRLAKTARDLKIRNKALLAGSGGEAGPSGEGSSNLLQHLESQLTTLRTELQGLYRTQAASQNKQLQMADSLRDRDEEVRGLREEVRILRDAKDLAARREKEWDERWKLRNRDLETLNDEIITQNLEISTLEQQNQNLKMDNANLVQRWLDKMNLTADEMNEDFEKESKAKSEGGVTMENRPSRRVRDLGSVIIPGSDVDVEEWEVLEQKGESEQGDKDDSGEEGWDEARRSA